MIAVTAAKLSWKDTANSDCGMRHRIIRPARHKVCRGSDVRRNITASRKQSTMILARTAGRWAPERNM